MALCHCAALVQSICAHVCVCVCLNFNITSIKSTYVHVFSFNSFTNQCVVYASLGARNFEYHGLLLEPVALVEYQPNRLKQQYKSEDSILHLFYNLRLKCQFCREKERRTKLILHHTHTRTRTTHSFLFYPYAKRIHNHRHMWICMYNAHHRASIYVLLLLSNVNERVRERDGKRTKLCSTKWSVLIWNGPIDRRSTQ